MRNIVNIEKLDQMLDEFFVKYRDSGLSLLNEEKLRLYIHGNIRNYALRKALISSDWFFYFRQKSYSEREIFRKSKGPYHQLNLQDLYFRVQAVLDFICYSGYVHKKPLTTLDFEVAEKKHSQWIKSLHKIEKTNEGKTKVVKTFENGFKIVLLIDKTSYEREGFLMKHCVSSYFGSNSVIYSLRNEVNKPLVTMEVFNQVVVQYLKVANSKVTEDVKPYLNEFAIDKKFKFKKVTAIQPSNLLAFAAGGFIVSGLSLMALRLYMISVDDLVPDYFPYLLGGAMGLFLFFLIMTMVLATKSFGSISSSFTDRL